MKTLRNNTRDFFMDRSYPSERVSLEFEVFHIEKIIEDYEEHRGRISEIYADCNDTDEMLWGYTYEECEMLREAESRLSSSRSRLALLA